MQGGELDFKWFQLAELLDSVIGGIPLLVDMGYVTDVLDGSLVRGYLTPDEEEVLYINYTDYLRKRVVLLDIVNEVKTTLHADVELSEQLRDKYFAIGYLAGLVLARAGKFIVRLAENNRVVRRKLDQAEVRFGLEWKSFSKLYRSLVSYRVGYEMKLAGDVYRGCEEELRIESEDSKVLRRVIALIDEELGVEDGGRRSFIVRRLKYRKFALRRKSKAAYRKVMFQIFRLSGSRIADLKQPHLAKAVKDVHSVVISEVKAMLKPGDVLVTRHADALSNLFLPGYWPHAALYIGGDRARVVEAKKDGVLERELEETLSVDAFLVLRPNLPLDAIDKVMTNALSHVGKRYDFVFDFAASNRLACTEVVYRSFHGVGDVSFVLMEKAGRKCLPAEDLIAQCIDSQCFEVVALFDGVERGLVLGESAREEFSSDRSNLLES